MTRPTDLSKATGVPFNSVGRAGVPRTEALSSLQRTWVRVLAWGPLLRVTRPTLSQPVSCRSSANLSTVLLS